MLILMLCIFLINAAKRHSTLKSNTKNKTGISKSGYSGPKWAFATNDGYNKYYGSTVFTNIIDVNKLPGASACKTCGDFVQLTTKYIQRFYDTHYPGGDFGKSDLLPVLLNPEAKTDCWSSLTQECFFTTKEECDKIRQRLLANRQNNPNTKIIYADLNE